MEGTELRLHFELEQTLGERHRIWPRHPAGCQVQLLQLVQQTGHEAVGIVDLLEALLDRGETILRQLDDALRLPALQELPQTVDHLLDAGHMIVGLAVGHEASGRQGLVERLFPYPWRRSPWTRGEERQPALQALVLARPVEEHRHQFLLLQAEEEFPHVFFAWASLDVAFSGGVPGEADGDAVLAEFAVLSDRAGAVVSELAILDREPDAIAGGSLNPGFDAAVASAQRPDRSLGEIRLAAVEGALPRQAAEQPGCHGGPQILASSAATCPPLLDQRPSAPAELAPGQRRFDRVTIARKCLGTGADLGPIGTHLCPADCQPLDRRLGSRAAWHGAHERRCAPCRTTGTRRL